MLSFNQLILNRFCAAKADAGREWMSSPFRHDGFLFATNGYIAVRIPDDPTINVLDNSAPKSICRIFDDHSQAELAPMPILPDSPRCKACRGTRSVTTKEVECDECDGRGEFFKGSHFYSCKECDGAGVSDVPTEDGCSRPCSECEGTGYLSQTAHQINGYLCDLRYLKLIADLPGVKISTQADGDKAKFSFDGGIGVLMTMRR